MVVGGGTAGGKGGAVAPPDGDGEITRERGSSASNGNSADGAGRSTGWTFLTNHAHVLVAIARNSELRQRDIAMLVGVTERAAQKILRELEDEGYVSRVRVGRRNHYELHADRPLRHPLESDHDVRELLELFTDDVRPDDVADEEMTRAS